MNIVQPYILPLSIFIGGIIVARITAYIINRTVFATVGWLIKYAPDFNRFILPFLYLGVLFATYKATPLNDDVEQVATYAFKIALIVLIIRLITSTFGNTVQSYLQAQDTTGTRLKQSRGIVLIINALLWIVGLVFLFDNLGFNVAAVLTGLGVGGIAIALAAQTILGDLFNYFVIFFDQPFELGDFIIVDDKMGAVEYIGLKTTRIRSLQGEQIIFSNSNLTNSIIHNYKRMNERRVLFKIRVVYETSSEKLDAIPSMIRSIIEEQGETRFDRAHFASFEDYSLNFEIVYYTLSADYNRYMDIQEKINLQIHRKFKTAKIAFALPTYSVDFRDSLEHQFTGARNGDQFGRDS